MIVRLAAAGCALAAFVVPLLVAHPRALVVTGLLGLLLAATGLATLWRWLVTAAACVWLVDYAAALWLAGGAPRVVGPTLFGLSLLGLLQSVELARATRRATIDATVVRSQTLGGAGFGAGIVAAVVLLAALSGGLAATIPLTAAPFLAAAGALGVLVTVAAMVRRSHEA
jgi:hypothetical protein